MGLVRRNNAKYQGRYHLTFLDNLLIVQNLILTSCWGFFMGTPFVQSVFKTYRQLK